MVNKKQGKQIDLSPIIEETHTKYIVAIQPATWEPEDMFFELHYVPNDIGMDESLATAQIYREVFKRHGFKKLDPPMLVIRPMASTEKRIQLEDKS